MIVLFAIIALVLAVACFAYAAWVSRTGIRLLLEERRHDPEAPPSSPSGFPSSQLARTAMLVGLLLLLLGATIAVVNRTVAPWNAQASSARNSSAHSSTDVGGGGDFGPATTTTSPSRSDGDYFALHMTSFRGPASLHSGALHRPLCLVRYYDRALTRRRGGDPGATWWTTCRYNTTLSTIAEVRERLALPQEWGARNGLVIAKIPAGSQVTYLAGVASQQCEPHRSRCYPGGGRQFLFRDEDFKRTWFTRLECSQTAETAPVRFAPCAG